MYDETVKRLKNCATQAAPCLTCDMTDDGSCIETLMKQAADAIEELTRRCEQFQYMPPPAWIPVTERLPEEMGNYLVAVNCPRGKWVEICACDGRDWVSVDEYAEYATKWVTHWMPLPQPPKEKV